MGRNPGGHMTRNGLVIGLLALVLVACSGQPASGGGGDTVGCRETLVADVTTSQTLTNGPESCDYYIPSDGSDTTLEVRADLTIQPGTVIRVGSNVRIRIGASGSITALGSDSAPIVFEGEVAEQGYWYGLCFHDNLESRLDHVEILWAGNLWTGSHVCNGAISGVSAPGGEPVHVTNSLIRGSRTSGLSAFGVNLGEFSNNVLADHRLYGARVSTSNLNALGSGDYLGNTIAGAENGRPYIHVSGTLSASGADHTWRDVGAPYFVTTDDASYGGNIIITDGATVSIEPGVTFVMDARTSISVEQAASLQAVGTEAAPITFRGASSTPGHWNGIRFRGASGSTIEHTEIAWAGGSAGDPDTGSVYIYRPGGTGVITFTFVVIRGTSACGIFVTSSGEQGVEINGVRVEEPYSGRPDLCGPFE